MPRSKLACFLGVMVLTSCLSGCDDPASNQTNVNIATASTAGIIDYGNGVYYFPYKLDGFGNSLSRFIKDHPEYELIALSGSGQGDYGRDDGYFVVFRVKGRD